MIITNWKAKIIVSLASKLTPGTEGVTLGENIYIWPPEKAENKRLIKHEMCHVRQWERYGKIGFLSRYIYEFIKYGYKASPLELEATLAEKE
jgi:hypothetical protein